MATHHPIRKTVTPEPTVIPDKLYFRIGDVAKLCDVPAYVLRFWETEFKQLKPGKGGTGQRLYRRKDVEMALRIKSLLYDQGYTIPGARQVFLAEARAKETGQTSAEVPAPAPEQSITIPQASLAVVVPQPAAVPGAEHKAVLTALRDDLRSLLTDLSQPLAITAAPTPEPPSKVKAMRPRLTLEPKPEPRPKVKPLKLEPIKLQQSGLFDFGPPEDDGPIAS